MDHISACIQEVMESYEVTLNGKTIPIKAINNVSSNLLDQSPD
jgi:methionyl aminopeptidase